MFKIYALSEYLSFPAGLNKIIFGIIVVRAINKIFIIYSVRSPYGMPKIEIKKSTI